MAQSEYKGEEFVFPDEKNEPEQQELDISDDKDFDEKASKSDVEDPTDEELAQYDDTVRNKLKKYTNNYHNERRARKAAQREREEAETFAKNVYEENRRLKEQLESGSKVFIEQNKSTAELELENAKKKLQKAFEEGDADNFAQAQVDVTRASMRLDKAESLRPIERTETYVPPQVFRQQATPKAKEWLESNSVLF
jgi:dsDNA-specific endonuclease/ATPase MutS2